MLAGKSQLIFDAADQLAKDMRKIGSIRFTDVTLQRIVPRHVGPTGMLIEGELVWNVKVSSQRHKRARRMTLVMPVLAGEPQEISTFKTANGQELQFTKIAVENYMKIRHNTSMGRRYPLAQLSFSG